MGPVICHVHTRPVHAKVMGAQITTKATHGVAERGASVHGACVPHLHGADAFMQSGYFILKLAVTHVDIPYAPLLLRVRKLLHLSLQRVNLVFGALPDGTLRLAIISTLARELGRGEAVD